MQSFHIEDYQKQKPFASFLSGIAGKKGIPLWAFYVNRGQLISSFGIRDKNGAIMEFFPANKAYQYTANFGFRTFVKVNGKVFEFFRETHLSQSLDVYPDRVTIQEENKDCGIAVKVTYHTLPNEQVAALVRIVEFKNLTSEEKTIEVVDGLTQILPYGIDYGGYKSISNLLQSWMQVDLFDTFVFYKLRASTHDEAEVKKINEGNFYASIGLMKPLYIYDYKLIFDEDTTLETPYGLMNHSLNQLRKMYQVPVNQVPCAMSGYAFTLRKSETISSLFGNASNHNELNNILSGYNLEKIKQKQQENEQLHASLTAVIETKSAYPIFDQYLKQCYLDNVLRGGVPMILETKEGCIGYHIYSRKHGDLERDYNFFTLEPSYYAQGNGNFRDVLQNRRNDLIFNPKLDDFNILMFTSFIQADGYNPLSIEGLTFSYDGDLSLPDNIKTFLKSPFTPGGLARQIENEGLSIDDYLTVIIKQSLPNYQAVFGEGYWEDHFTYLLDLYEQYQSIYPDRMQRLLFEKQVKYFDSPVEVLPRDQKYVLTKEGQIRQYGAMRHVEKKTQWLMANNKPLATTVYAKLLLLAVNKYAHLDPDGIGLSYEANKPGWNDAANGLPGLFGSGVSEMLELYRLVKFLKTFNNQQPMTVIKAFDQLAESLLKINKKTMFDLWDARMTALETYREQIYHQEIYLIEKHASDYQPMLDLMIFTLRQAITKAEEITDIIPTYLTYEAIRYDELHTIGEYGLPTVRIKAFKRRALPTFLEGPARLLKVAEPKQATLLYHKVKNSGLYDQKLQMYQTSVALDDEPIEIGRLKAFTKGWLERESNFLHMTYKYLYGLLRAEQFDLFAQEIKTNYVCFMDSNRYGRPPTENVSFIATSCNPDPKKHGQGFVSRLSGSTSEILSMWQMMCFGNSIFNIKDGELIFQLKPSLPHDFFYQKQFMTTLFGKIEVIYHNQAALNTYDKDAVIGKYVIYHKDGKFEIDNDQIKGKWAQDIRKGDVFKIDAYIIKGGK